MSRVILVDTSGSMNERATAEQRRIDVAQSGLNNALRDNPDARVIAFSSHATVLDRGMPLPTAGGGTALAAALEAAAAFSPTLVVVLSDGLPDNADAASAAARALNCRIAVVYCGDPADHNAALFMQQLAWCSSDGLGETLLADLRQPQRLESDLRRLLSGPAS